jgi:GAF domain-containing protein
MGDMPDDVGEEVARLNGVLRAQRTLAAKLEAVAELVEDTVPTCDGASIALVVEEAAFTGATSSQVAIEADLAQYRNDEGPCLASVAESATVRIDLLLQDERFEHFAAAAIELGVESVLSIPLRSGDVVVGSINMYSAQPNAFDDDVPDQISRLSDYASRLIVASPLYESAVHVLRRLMDVVDDAAQVEIAVGILIIREDMTAGAAWEHLDALAGHRGSSVVEAARRIVEEHERTGLGHRSGPVPPGEQ